MRYYKFLQSVTWNRNEIIYDSIFIMNFICLVSKMITTFFMIYLYYKCLTLLVFFYNSLFCKARVDFQKKNTNLSVFIQIFSRKKHLRKTFGCCFTCKEKTEQQVLDSSKVVRHASKLFVFGLISITID